MPFLKLSVSDAACSSPPSPLPPAAQILEAAGGLLFVDEAYRLVPEQRADEKDYGAEALEEIMAAMDGCDSNVVVILAGYAEPMQRVFAVNEGFRRRVQRVFVFDDLSPSDIAQVMTIKMREAQEEAQQQAQAFDGVMDRSPGGVHDDVSGSSASVAHPPLTGARDFNPGGSRIGEAEGSGSNPLRGFR